ncbi:MAG: hypothetical protein ACRDBY_00755 [Cetobacterium sp.]
MNFKELFLMINNKNKQIKQLEFERDLINRELLRLVNSRLRASRIHAKLTVDEFEKVVNKKGCIPITDIIKYSYKTEYTEFTFTHGKKVFKVRFTTYLEYVYEEFFDEDTLDCFDIYLVDGNIHTCIYTGYDISEIRLKLIDWIGMSDKEIKNEYTEYVKNK